MGLLFDAGLAPIADAVGENRLQARLLTIAHGHFVIAEVDWFQLAFDHIVRQGLARDHSG